MKTLKDQEEKLQESNIEIIKIENEKNKINMEIKRGKESLGKFNDEIRRLNIELDVLEKDEEKLKEELDLIIKENHIVQENVKKLLLEFEEVKVYREEAMKEVTDVKIQMKLIENKLANNEERVNICEIEIENTIHLIKMKEEELLQNNKEIDNITKNIFHIEGEISKLTELKERNDEKFAALREEKDILMKDYYLEQNRLNKINEKMNELVKIINKWDLKETRYSVQSDNIYTKLMEDYELDYKDAMKLWVEIDDIKLATEEMKN